MSKKMVKNRYKMTPMPQNYKGTVNWVLKAYTDAGVTFPNGFQKDAIQNAAGAREAAKWGNWNVDISYVENDKGKFVVIEDSGTTGLTGKITPLSKVHAMMAEGKVFTAQERFARFASQFNSGGNTYGGGLYGAGKSVYAVASDEYVYYFDSLRGDGKYISSVNEKGILLERARLGDSARRFIFENTGLPEKTKVGTRIIIASPKEELVDSIKTGEIVSFIQESWWRIIKDLPGDASISVNGIPVVFPTAFADATKKYVTSTPEKYAGKHVVKSFGLYVFEDGKAPWTGIRYLRKGMTIGDVDIKNIPEKLENNFCGYVEVDDNWEDELAHIEDNVHFGISKGKKNSATYQDLKNYCNDAFNSCMQKWGYVKTEKDDSSAELKKELEDISRDLAKLFDKINIDPLEGSERRNSYFDIKLFDVVYPKSGTEKVTSGDTISFGFQLNNNYSTKREFKYTVSVRNANDSQVLVSGDISAKAGCVKAKKLSYTVTNALSKQHAKNSLVVSVKEKNTGKEQVKTLPYYFDAEKRGWVREVVNVSLCECTMPTKGSKRVNFGESIRNLKWRIDNRANDTLEYQLKVTLHNASEGNCPKIADIGSFTGTVLPFEQSDALIDEIRFDEKEYEKFLTKGRLEVRASLVANDDNKLFEKGDRISTSVFHLFLNMPEEKDLAGAFDPQMSYKPDKFERSWRKPGKNRNIVINTGHAAYKLASKYADIRHEYLKEQLMKQYVLMYMDEGKTSIFKSENGGKDISELETSAAVDRVMEKIESIYYQSQNLAS